ncbi:HD domain-containing protein [Sphingomonas sp. PAMC 26605]|uniref:HD domain-containing protein n=1 Tax=Sphingomonas sp. PAMC 26605 TaxID=1112214 RepID=UPI00026CDE40|nr:HD domain-containing protein [Sphingomonas sp. PAMC 26605]
MTIQHFSGIAVPDSAIARDITAFIRETENDLLFNHSSRVYLWAASAGQRKGMKFDPELLYAGAMFHDVGLTPAYKSSSIRFEVDGANAARDFLRGRGIAEADIEKVWTGIALHTTPGIPEHMHPEIALVTAGVEMDVLGIGYDAFTDDERDSITRAHPRGDDFKNRIIDAFYDGMKHRPDSTFGTVNDDVLALRDPTFVRQDFCQIILGSHWHA